jgi:hypothetical protein
MPVWASSNPSLLSPAVLVTRFMLCAPISAIQGLVRDTETGSERTPGMSGCLRFSDRKLEGSLDQLRDLRQQPDPPDGIVFMLSPTGDSNQPADHGFVWHHRHGIDAGVTD